MGIRLLAICSALKYKGIKILIVRRTYPELVANHVKPLCEMLSIGTKNSVAKYNKTEKEFVFLNGSTIKLGYCNNDNDAEQYQGQEYDLIFLDEATLLREEWIRKITACCRGVNGFPKHIYYTCNPNGESLAYIKRLFIDRRYEEGEDPDEYEFIQSSVYDNKALMKANPDYIKQLEALPPKLKEAWLYGRWDVNTGAYFSEFRDRPDIQMCHEAGITPEQALAEHRWTHVIEPFDIPKDWKIYRSYDWGYGRPWAMTYYGLDRENVAYEILEIYGCTKTPNEGVKWTNKQQFDYIRQVEDTHPYLKGRRIQGVADPAIWDGSKDGNGISAADEADKHGIWLEKGNNSRIQGWMQVRERLKFDQNGFARLYIFNTCKDMIRTIPLQMFDDVKVEDLDSDIEDHLCLSGDTQVLTKDGYKTIESLVGTEGEVMSSDGEYHHYHDCMMTRAQVDVYEVELEDGTKICGTADHLILTDEGWTTIGALLGGCREVKTIFNMLDT